MKRRRVQALAVSRDPETQRLEDAAWQQRQLRRIAQRIPGVEVEPVPAHVEWLADRAAARRVPLSGAEVAAIRAEIERRAGQLRAYYGRA